MPKIETPIPLDPNDGISPQIWKYLNSWPNKPVSVSRIGLDHVDKLPVAIALQQISGTLVDRQYMDGGFIGRWPFVIFVKVQGDDTASRLSAVGVLNDLYRWMKQNPPEDIGTGRQTLHIEQRETPVRVGAYEDGTEIYQGVYVLRYKQSAGY